MALESQRQKLSEVRSQTEAETKKLLAQRKEELGALEAGWQERIEPLETQSDKLRNDIRSRRLQLATVESSITGLKAQLEEGNKTLAAIDGEARVGQALLDSQTTQLVGINTQIAEARDLIAPLQIERVDLESELILLRKKYEALELNIAVRQDDFAQQEQDAQSTLKRLQRQSQDAINRLTDSEHEWESIRRDLAARAVKANEREDTLHAREMRVNRDERNLARNNELLGL